jgi:hypothetical protein
MYIPDKWVTGGLPLRRPGMEYIGSWPPSFQPLVVLPMVIAFVYLNGIQN